MATSLPQGATLPSLPNELLIEVFSYIDCFEPAPRAASFFGLSLTNRRLHRSISSYLYSTYSFHAGSPSLFLRTICQDRELASQVKAIHWDYDTGAAEKFVYKSDSPAGKQSFQLAEAREQLVHMATQGSLVAGELADAVDLGRLYLGDQRALDTLLMFTPNIKHLEVVETYRWDDHCYWFKPILFGDSQKFSQLTSATLHGPMRLENVAALLLLPSMRRLELCQVTDMRRELDRRFEWEQGSNPSSFRRLLELRGSNVEYLHLYDSFLRLIDLWPILRAIRTLKSFLYEHKENDLSADYVPFDLVCLERLLTYQRQTLTSVCISDTCNSVRNSEQDGDGLFKLLQGFPSLLNLELFYDLWKTGHRREDPDIPELENLPQNLEHLTIECLRLRYYTDFRYDSNPSGFFADLGSKLAALAVHKRQGAFPNLHSLTIAKWHPWYGSVPSNFSYFKTMLEKVGVRFCSVPAEIDAPYGYAEDIGWVELQTEPDWVFIEIYDLDHEELHRMHRCRLQLLLAPPVVE